MNQQYSAAEHGTIARGLMIKAGQFVLPGKDSTVTLELDNTLFYKTVIKNRDENGVIVTNEDYAFDNYNYKVSFFRFSYTDKTPNPAQLIGMMLGSFKMKYVSDSINCMRFTYPANFQFLYHSLINTNLPDYLSINSRPKSSFKLECVYGQDLEKYAKEQVKTYKKAGWKNVAVSDQQWKGQAFKQVSVANENDDNYYRFIIIMPKGKCLLRIECLDPQDTFSATWALKHIGLILDSAEFK